MNYSNKIRARLKGNALKLESNNTIKGFERKTAYIFDNISMNFNKDSFDNIHKNNDWKSRLAKRHTHFPDQNIYEMQSANSSDALLMNIFCHPQFTKWIGPKKLLKIEKYDDITFGWNPIFKNENPKQRTEIDLKINNTDIIIEAKLTESDFTSKEIDYVERYEKIFTVFDKNQLKITNGKYENYQLIRNILAAKKYNSQFILLIDETRIDLIRHFYETINAVKDINLVNNLRFITWQEITELTGISLKEYIENKYFNKIQ